MIAVILLITAIAVALLAILWFAVRGRSAAVTDLSDIESLTKPVDLEAFRNLVDPEEEEYLRSNLSAADFRSVQRERLLAAVDYMTGVSRNAAVLLRLGELARRSSDAEVAVAGQDLVNNALYLRSYVLLAILKLRLRVLLPGAKMTPGRVLDFYESMTGSVGRLARLQKYPAPAKSQQFFRIVGSNLSRGEPLRHNRASVQARDALKVPCGAISTRTRVWQEFVALKKYRDSELGSGRGPHDTQYFSPAAYTHCCGQGDFGRHIEGQLHAGSHFYRALKVEECATCADVLGKTGFFFGIPEFDGNREVEIESLGGAAFVLQRRGTHVSLTLVRLCPALSVHRRF